MTYRIAINGFGRIGRSYLRCMLERDLLHEGVRVVAINDVWDPGTLAHLLVHDSTFGTLRAPVSQDDTALHVAGHTIAAFRERCPDALPWADLGIDLVIESTGKLRAREDAALHLKAGARRVLISSPGKGVDVTVVSGINHTDYDPALHHILSAACCTTNCVAPMAKVLHEAFGLEHGFLTSVHAYTNDQNIRDTPHQDLRRARAATVNIIPSSTGAAKAVGRVLPALAGRLGGVALGVPVENGSICHLTCELSVDVTAAQVNEAFATAAAEGQPLRGILRYTEAPTVSRDIVGDPASCIFDAGLTQASGRTITVFGWFDNERGYTNRLVDLTSMIASRDTF